MRPYVMRYSVKAAIKFDRLDVAEARAPVVQLSLDEISEQQAAT